MKRFFALFIFLIGFAAQAETIEIRSMKQILPHVEADTLVVFDLDNTVLEPVQMLGSDMYFGHLIDLAKAHGLSQDEAVNDAVSKAAQVQPLSPVRAVEQQTPKLIQWLQKSVSVMALTARPPEWIEPTLQQVHSIGVDFSRNPPAEIHDLKSGQMVAGAFFLRAHNDKGPALVEYLHAAKLSPRRILFIDDRPKNVESVEQALEEAGYAHTSFRYGAADDEVKAFDPVVADFEGDYLSAHHRWISDQEARQLMSTAQSK